MTLKFFYHYFRCYSPVAFQKKNNPKYICKYVPALQRIPDKYIYELWKVPKDAQKKFGCVIGVDYPKPIVDHAKVSKANMIRMTAAYDAHKAMAEKDKADAKKGTTKSSGKDISAKQPVKKRQKRQPTLK
eukprot:15324542-Ditylum_brightwellii.AAC.1